jgi:hypothetical protein
MTREEAQQVLDALLSQYEQPPINVPIIELLRARLAQPEPEPVAWLKKDRSSIEVSIMSAEYMKNAGFEPLYTAPPKREWVGLTDEEANELTYASIAEIEAKLKEKNYD